MHMRAETVIIAHLFLVSSWLSISLADTSTDSRTYPLGIDWGPAPSPEDGPPLSAKASRNKALLPFQIAGIVGSYLICVCVIGIALLIIGRRLRVQSQRSLKALDIELLEPHNRVKSLEETPVTPGASPGHYRNFSWPSPEKNQPHPYVFPPSLRSPRSPAEKDPYVDDRVVQADREVLQRDLEDIYAHVMEQEEAKAAGVDVKELPPPAGLKNAVPAPQGQNAGPKKIEKARKPLTLNIEDDKSTKSHSRSSSIISTLKSPKRKGIRGLRISSPIPTPLSANFAASGASDEEPLSPRFYSPPPPPPVPKDQIPFTHTRNNSNVQNESPTRSIAEQLSSVGTGSQHHRANISLTSVQSSRGDGASITSQTPLYQATQQPNTSTSKLHTHNNSSRVLPLRQFEPALTSPSFSHSTKTTVLERTSPVSPRMRTGGLKSPWSAGAVPYSPYQPFTPMMPITPRLVTKEERKAKKKMEARTPVLEMIKSDDELWDSGY